MMNTEKRIIIKSGRFLLPAILSFALMNICLGHADYLLNMAGSGPGLGWGYRAGPEKQYLVVKSCYFSPYLEELMGLRWWGRYRIVACTAAFGFAIRAAPARDQTIAGRAAVWVWENRWVIDPAGSKKSSLSLIN